MRDARHTALALTILVLTVATAGIHLVLGFAYGSKLFILNGLGYLGLLAAYQLPVAQLVRWRGATRWVLVTYAAVTIVLYFVLVPFYDPIGLADKAIEVALIALLLVDGFSGRAASTHDQPGAGDSVA